MPYVYVHIRHDKKEIFYVGIGMNHESHERARSLNRNKIWKHIVEKTTYDVHILNDNISWEDAVRIEIELIKKFGRIDQSTGILANLTDGGEGTPGRIKSESEIAKISGLNNGSHSKSWIKKENREMLADRDLLDSFFVDGWRKGRIVSDNTRMKISRKNKGRKLSEDHKKKLGDKSRGHIKTTQERERRSASLKGRVPWNKGIPGFKKLTKEEKLALKLSRLNLENFQSQ